MIEQMEKEGALKSRLTAKIAGGAQMFAFSTNNDMLRVGERNVEAVKAKLRKLGIHILAGRYRIKILDELLSFILKPEIL